VSQFLSGKGISAMDHQPYFPDLAPADFWLFPKLKSVLKGKRFSDFEDIKSSVKKCRQTFFVRILKTVFDNGRSARNIVENWREMALKYSRLLTSAHLKIDV
jgi:hypothetical protein